ncbi:MAG: DNRLRE domain-containing protein [Candidatus Bathyarchaeota archaeon]|nr:DNRLRE domain-containing protein [Candidatus Bathyarchaeota archaeon]
MKKALIISLFVFILLIITVFPSITSSQLEREYDPMLDTNDDGAIRVDDVLNIALHFGTSGTPINITALLLELLNLIEDMNTTISELQDRVAELEARVEALEQQFPNTQTLFSSDDAQTIRQYYAEGVWTNTSDYNYGNLTWLVVRTTTTDDREGRFFLKFSLSSIQNPDDIASVKLFLCHSGYYPSGWGGVGNVEARAVSDDSWTEANITWNNQPSYEDLLETVYIMPGSIQWYSWNVTSFILNELAGDQVASICLKAENENEGSTYRWALFRSKEYNGLDPYLLIEYK